MNKAKCITLVGLAAIILVGLLGYILNLPETSWKGRAISSWLGDLDNKKPSVRRTAEDAIKQMGKKAMPEVISYLREGNSRLRQFFVEQFGATPASAYERRALVAIQILGPAAKPAIPEVERALLEGDGDLRSSAASALVAIGPEAVIAMQRALDNTNAQVRHVAAWYIGGFGIAAGPSIPRLVAELQSLDPDMRANAAHSLGTIRARPEIVVPALTGNLGETNYRAFVNVSKALESYGPEATSAVPALERELHSGNPSRRASVSIVLREIDGEAAKRAGLTTPQILRTLQDGDESSRVTAGLILLWMRDDSEIVAPGVVPALSDMNAHVRGLALEILGKHQQTSVPFLSTVAEYLNDSDESVREAATDAVVRIDPRFFRSKN